MFTLRHHDGSYSVENMRPPIIEVLQLPGFSGCRRRKGLVSHLDE